MEAGKGTVDTREGRSEPSDGFTHPSTSGLVQVWEDHVGVCGDVTVCVTGHNTSGGDLTDAGSGAQALGHTPA